MNQKLNQSWQQRLHDLRHFSYMLTLPLLHLVYRVLNADRGIVYSLVTDLDRLIPFNKYFIVPYMLWAPFVLVMMVYFFVRDRKVYFNVLITINISLLVNYLIYSVFQTTVPRPEVAGADFWSGAVRLLYAVDKPYNCFPSGHVTTAFAVLLGCYKLADINRKLAFGAKITVILIILSTLFLKQHVVMDALASIVLVSLIMYVVEAFNWGRLRRWPEEQKTWMRL